MPPELTIELGNDIFIKSTHKELTAGSYVHIFSGDEMVWRMAAHEIASNPSKFLRDFADQIYVLRPELCRQQDSCMVVELEDAWMAIGEDAIGFYDSPEAAATFGHIDGDTEEIVYWNIDEIGEDTELVVGAILGAIAKHHSEG